MNKNHNEIEILNATYHPKSLGEVFISESVEIKNPTLKWALACDKDIKEKAIYKQLLREKREYFSLLDKIFSYPDFKEFFMESGGNVSLREIHKNFDKKLVQLVETLGSKSYLFFKRYDLSGDIFFDSTLDYNYSIMLNGEILDFAVSQTNMTYPSKFGEYLCWWNWATDNRYFVWSFYDYLVHELNIGTNTELYKAWDRLGCYASFDMSYDEENEGFDIGNNVWKYLIQTRFVKVYRIRPDYACGSWMYFAKPDNTIDMCLFDRNKFDAVIHDKTQAISLQKRIAMILNLDVIYDGEQYYFLLDGKGKPYVSAVPGKFGGHKKLKIYGQLDCPSAKRYIKQGKYVKHRVFFANEEDAISAGYRPCAICMPEKYREWSAKHT